MTAYFDGIDSELRRTFEEWKKNRADYTKMTDRFDELERKLVFDCSLACSTPGFPDDLKLAINRVILKYGIQTQPPNAVPADFETEDEHVRRLQSMSGDLHTVFHAAAHRDLPGLDTPTRYISIAWFNPREEEREKLAATEFGGEDPEAYIKRVLGDGS